MANSTRRYALSDYVVAITFPRELQTILNGGSTNASTNNADNGLTIGGSDSYLSSISVSLSATTFSTSADATGSWVTTKNLDKHGEVTLTLYQVADKVTKLRRIFNIYYANDDILEGMTITVQNQRGTIVCTCTDCYISSIPEQTMGESASTQQWKFTCGKIDF